MKKKFKIEWPTEHEQKLEVLKRWKYTSTKHKIQFLEEALRFGNYWKKQG